MTCPDWKALVAAREARREDPPGWHSSLEHLASCDACRREALAAEPTLLFQRLPRVEVGAAEVDAMRGAVATLVRARRLGASAAAAPPGRRALPGRWLQPAAAAALLTAALSLGPAVPAPDSGEATTAPSAELAPRTRAGAPAYALLEDLDLPEARVYQLAQGDLSVVMIVDSSLDL